jgi:hypothetical protein
MKTPWSAHHSVKIAPRNSGPLAHSPFRLQLLEDPHQALARQRGVNLDGQRFAVEVVEVSNSTSA